MPQFQFDEVKEVWVAWSNTDRTEGRGYEFPLHIAESQEAAERLGHGGSVQGCDCRVTRERAYRMKGMWYVPGQIERESKEDTTKRTVREAREAALERAKAAGLSDEDLALLTKR